MSQDGDGTVPDILFNSHGIPSRMTMGQMWETVLSKLNALLGDVGTCGVPFTEMERMLAACDGLHTHGYPRMGREQFYSGITGEPLDGPTFCGVVFYQRLRICIDC
jgi:DNA-directed RNA polymerase beta subunit